MFALVLVLLTASPAKAGPLVKDLKVSSFRPEKTKVEQKGGEGLRMVGSDFKAERIVDPSPTSAWCSAKGKSQGQWIAFTLTRPAHGFQLGNGFIQKSEAKGAGDWPGLQDSESFLEHGRIRTLTLTSDKGFHRKIAVDDTQQAQTFAVELEPGKYKAVIDAVEEGGSEDDVCLGSLQFVTTGQPAPDRSADSEAAQFEHPELAPLDPFRGQWRCRWEGGSRGLELARAPATREENQKVTGFQLTMFDPTDTRLDTPELLHSRPRQSVQVPLAYNEVSHGLLLHYPDCTAKELEEIRAGRFAANRCAQIYAELKASGANRLQFVGNRSQGYGGEKTPFQLDVAGTPDRSVGVRAELGGKDALIGECKRVE